MARDNELRLTFSDVSATTNVAGVDRDVTSSPYRGGLVTLVTTANQWAVGYSDALNFTHWRNQVADISNLTTSTPTTAIAGDPILSNGTALSEYYIRTAVAPVGLMGPSDVQIIAQAANDTGAGTAGTAFAAISNPVNIPANASAITANFSLASPTVVTPTAGSVPASGSIVIFTALGGGVGPVVRIPYIVLQQSATTFTMVSTLGGTTGINASTGGTSATLLAGNNATGITPTSVASDRIVFTETLAVGDTIIFGNVGSIVGITAGTLYYVVAVTSTGVQIATSSGGSAITGLGTTLGTPFAGKVNIANTAATFVSSVASNVITTTAPHGLSVGQMVVATTTAGSLAAGQGYYVNTVPSATTFTVSATVGGSTATVTATPGNLFVGRPPRLVMTQVGMTTRPWLRVAVQQLNSSAVQDGYVMFYNADISVGRDGSMAG